MKCKYYDSCEQAQPTARTCIETGGGSYCGKYRILASISYSDSQVSLKEVPVVQLREALVV